MSAEIRTTREDEDIRKLRSLGTGSVQLVVFVFVVFLLLRRLALVLENEVRLPVRELYRRHIF